MNSILIDRNFEREKNIKAFIITIIICILLFFIFFLLTFTLPAIPPPIADEGIEVNLGNSETGMGNIEPQAPGDPALSQNSNPAPAQQNNTPESSVDDKGDEAINSTVKNTVPTPTKPVTTTVKAPVKTVPNPTPKPQTPKAVFGGGTKNNTGGNNSDTYNGVKNQGIAGGNGNQGVPGGNPNSDTYGPGGGNGGINIRSGLSGRKVAFIPKFEDEFNKNAKVAVDVTVDENGKVIAAVVNLRGTTIADPKYKTIAVEKAYKVKFTSGSETQNGTIVFDFKVTN